MMVIAAFGALALGEYDEAASVSCLFSISERLETQATGKARRALEEIVSLRPDYAHVVDKESGRITIILASDVPLGSFCSVRTGDKVPADGIVVEGRSSVDESSITGEARPVDKVAGSDVSAGSINVGSTQLVIKTTSTVGDSTVSRLIALVEEAQTNRSETEKLVDSFAKKYTPFVLATAVLVSTGKSKLMPFS
jgi:Cd2+/Zn2+-exporting ATPase